MEGVTGFLENELGSTTKFCFGCDYFAGSSLCPTYIFTLQKLLQYLTVILFVYIVPSVFAKINAMRQDCDTRTFYVLLDMRASCSCTSTMN